MRARHHFAVLTAAMALAAISAASAFAALWVGPDPAHNFAVTPPAVCTEDGDGSACVTAAIGALDASRASVGRGPYMLPRNFAALSQDQQAFVLTDLDRVLAGLPAIPGISAPLSDDATAGVLNDNDPRDTQGAVLSATANWAGGFANVLYAYQAWMYDDGPGAHNLDCTAQDASGCWGHRHDILWSFPGGGELAMGVAAGADASGHPGYALLIAQSGADVPPAYTYTWTQAVASGANNGHLGPAAPTAPTAGGAPVETPAGSSTPVSVPIEPAAGTAAAARSLRISLGALAYSDNTLSFTVSMTTVRGSLTGFATDATRRLRLTVERSGDAFHFSCALGVGTWHVTVVPHLGRGWTAPVINAGVIRII